MGDEATATGGGNDTAVAVSDTPIEAIVDSLGDNTPWSSVDTKETTPPATGSASDTTETGKGKKPAKTEEPPAAEVPAAQPEFFSDEQLGKFTLKEIANPSFDWSKVPPAWTNAFKGWQADATRLSQQLAETRRQQRPERTPKPQPTEGAEVDPQDAANRQIVADALKAQGIDPSVLAEMSEDAVRLKGIALAAQSVPEYLQDENFMNAVNDAIVRDPELAELADSGEPEGIAYAIRAASLQVRNSAMSTQIKGFQDREAAITAKEKDLSAKIQALEEERTKLNRTKPTVAGGSSQGKPPAAPKKDSDKGLGEIVDDLGFFEGGKTLRLG